MSLTLIAMMGILLGFLCLMVGFFMEGTEGRPMNASVKEKRVHRIRRRVLSNARKAA